MVIWRNNTLMKIFEDKSLKGIKLKSFITHAFT